MSERSEVKFCEIPVKRPKIDSKIFHSMSRQKICASSRSVPDIEFPSSEALFRHLFRHYKKEVIKQAWVWQRMRVDSSINGRCCPRQTRFALFTRCAKSHFGRDKSTPQLGVFTHKICRSSTTIHST